MNPNVCERALDKGLRGGNRERPSCWAPPSRSENLAAGDSSTGRLRLFAPICTGPAETPHAVEPCRVSNENRATIDRRRLQPHRRAAEQALAGEKQNFFCRRINGLQAEKNCSGIRLAQELRCREAIHEPRTPL
jgi:hypothetical protein